MAQLTQTPPAPRQLSLSVSLNDQARFDNFYVRLGSPNASILALLQAQARGEGEAFVYLWGPPGVGLTHLLQAACHTAEAAGLSIQYLPLRELLGFAPGSLLEEMDSLDFLCLDGLEAIAGRSDWEEALFHLYNRLHERGGRLLVAAVQGPRELPLGLPDLRSRLQWGVTCQLESLSDEHKREALRYRAKARGLELSEEVADYVLQRVSRDMNQLFCNLERLDHASLAEQRKLTIPFVKKVLNL